MAFCNSCGATIDPAAKFCPKCGKGLPVTAGTVSPAPVAPQSNNTMKIVLIAVGVIVVLFIVGSGVAAFVGWKVAHSTHVTESEGNVKVDTPFGTVESTTDSDAVTRALGVDAYPGATARKSGAANVNFGGVHSVAAEFETNDPADKVAEFYKSKFPKANVVSSEGEHYSIVATEDKNVITISIEPEDGKTRIHIASVSGKAVKTGDSSN